jgi:hypothetical protein
MDKIVSQCSLSKTVTPGLRFMLRKIFKPLPPVPIKINKASNTSILSKNVIGKIFKPVPIKNNVSTTSTFSCPKCPKILSTKYWLNQHLMKSLPCDLKCRQCDFQGKDRFHYYRHQKTKHPNLALVTTTTPPKQKKKDDEVLTLQPVQQNQIRPPINFIPWNQLLSRFEVTEHFYEKVEHSKDKEGEEFAKVQGYERRTNSIFRAENARRSHFR